LEKLQIMLRIVSFVVAIVAIMAIPLSQADARGPGMHSGGSMGRGHIGGPGVGGGPRIGSFNSIRSRSIIVGGHRFHHRRYPFFVGVGGYGLYDGCWRWLPSVYGYRRVWVCDSYYGDY
jgi:hypothetical protein